MTRIWAVAMALALGSAAWACASGKADCDGGPCDEGDGCPVGFADCNGDPADGCEADLASPDTCGSCALRCTAPPEGEATCQAGSCGFACTGGLVTCGEACVPRCGETYDAPGRHDFEVPTGCSSVRVQAWGAGGGDGAGNQKGAAGGYAEGVFDVTAGENLAIVVGGPGESAPGRTGGAGGTPGGGGRGGNSDSQGGGGGGGFSGVFRTTPSVDTAVILAGGGGGSGGGVPSEIEPAGAGGGLDGEAGSSAGGSQTDGFSHLAGGPGGNQNSGDGGGGGGGGYWGGFGGAGANTDAGSGGGGSGFVAPDVREPVLETGAGRIPARAGDMVRGVAGDPASPGKVLVDCL